MVQFGVIKHYSPKKVLPKTKLISKACSILENRASVQSDPKAVKSKNRTLELMETTLMNSVAEVDESGQ